MFLSRKFANTRSTKALRDYFALAESQPTCATLEGLHFQNFSVSSRQGGRSWRPFGERKIIPQSFRRARIFKFSRQKRRFLQLRKYWLFLAK